MSTNQPAIRDLALQVIAIAAYAPVHHSMCLGVVFDAGVLELDLYTDCAYYRAMDYRWDPDKASSNLAKHGVDLADAVGVFQDEWAMTIKEEYVAGEQRFATMGTDFLERVLVMVYTHRGEQILLISARRATRQERSAYERKRV